ncbi:MAG: hypothetical protein VB118_08625 [Oscillospiraceae bacterium]|nr:hypothetical protein [Oscillospiraceae bacterium]
MNKIYLSIFCVLLLFLASCSESIDTSDTLRTLDSNSDTITSNTENGDDTIMASDNVYKNFKENIQFGVWNGFLSGFTDEQHAKALKDAGIDFVIDGYNKKILDLCEKNDLKYLIHDALDRDPYANIAKLTASYKDSPAFLGNILWDEPSINDYNTITKITEAYKKAFPDKFASVNLLPLYATEQQIGTSDYKKYVKEFADKVATDFISVDIYPLTIYDNGEMHTYDNFINCFAIVADECRSHNLDFRTYIQAIGWDSYYDNREASIEDLRFQLYTALSFGSKVIIYWRGAPSDLFPTGFVSTAGELTELYYRVQKVNSEIKSFSNIYMKYKSLGAYTVNSGKVPAYVKNYTDQYNNFNIIKTIETTQSILVGCFDKDNDSNSKAFTIVNMSELADKLPTDVLFTLTSDKSTVTAYIKGVPTVLTNAGNGYKLTLESGEGVFITIE